MEFKDALKLEAIKIAAQEAIDIDGKLKPKEMMKRAMLIYSAAYEANVDKWEELPKKVKRQEKPIEQETSNNQPQKEEKKQTKNMKECKLCGEMVPEAWMVHNYTSEGKKCGYRWV